MDLSTVVGFVLAFGLVFAAILFGGSIYAFIDYPSVLIVVGGVFALTLVAFPLPNVLGIFTSIHYAFFPMDITGNGKKPGLSKEEAMLIKRRLECGIGVLGKMKVFSVAMGAIGFFIGLVSMLQNLDDPSKIGPAVALSLLTVLYGIIIGFMICYPLQSKLEMRLRDLEMLHEDLLLE